MGQWQHCFAVVKHRVQYPFPEYVIGGPGLRYVAHALLEGVEASGLEVGDGKYRGDPVVASAEYMRDRVGVPRDLPYPAARQLRAHLNWLINSLEGC